MNSDLPDGPSELTTSWLAAVLRSARHEVRIGDVAVEQIGSGLTGSCFRMTVRYSAPADLPASFVVKLPANDPEVRERVAFGYRAEVAFYDTVAATVRVPTPACYHSAISADGQRFVLLLDDLSAARPGDQLLGCTLAEARSAVVALAGLHAPRWCDPSWRDFTATAMPMADSGLAAGLAEVAQLATGTFLDRLGDRLGAADQQTLAGYPGRVGRWLLARPQRFSLLHGDYRLDNLIFGPPGPAVTVVDWQTLSVGLPTRDLAYFVSTSLPPALRAQHERSLVGAYHEALTGLGVRDYDLAECFADYRFSMLQTPLITTLGAAFSATTDRGDEVALALVERAGAAIRDLDTFELIDIEVT
jgi:Phosphotransferase enzyme family